MSQSKKDGVRSVSIMHFFKPKVKAEEGKESEPMANLFSSQEEPEEEEDRVSGGGNFGRLKESLRRVDFTRVETTASEAHFTHRDDKDAAELEDRSDFTKVMDDELTGAADANVELERAEEVVDQTALEEQRGEHEEGVMKRREDGRRGQEEDEDDLPVTRKRTNLFQEESQEGKKFKKTHEDLWRELEEELNPPTPPTKSSDRMDEQLLFDDEEEEMEEHAGEDEDLLLKTESEGASEGRAQDSKAPLNSFEFSEDRTSATLTLGKDAKNTEDNLDFNERELYMSCFASNNSSGFKAFVDNYYRYKGTFSFPPWLELRNIKDAEGNRPTEPTYNPSTLWIPPKSHRWASQYKSGHYTECMQQWWEVKSKYFDSLVFFKMGRFYELFYHDACIIQSLVNLRWMGSESKPHVGFPEKSLHFYASSCVAAGYRVVVVEQTETPMEMERRNREEGTNKKTVKRDVCEIITPGSVTRPEMLGKQGRPLVFISSTNLGSTPPGTAASSDCPTPVAGVGGSFEGACNGHDTGFKQELALETEEEALNRFKSVQAKTEAGRITIVSIDVSMSRVKFGSIEYSPDFAQLKTVLVHLFPAEVVIDKNLMDHEELVRNVRALPYTPEVTWHTLNIDENELYAKVKSNFGNVAKSSKSALVLAQSYLKQILLDRMVDYCYVEPLRLWEMEVMRMDFSSIVHLELFKTQEGTDKNSLFDHLNKTMTNFGERLLRNWLLNPLTDVNSINRRSECVSYLVANYQLVTTLSRDLEGFPDIERMLGKVLNTASNYHKRAVYFDEAIFFKLYEFHSLLDKFNQLEDVVLSFLNYSCGEGVNDEEDKRGGQLLQDMKREMATTSEDILYFKSMIKTVGERKCQSLNWSRSQLVQRGIDAVLAKLEKVLDQIRASCPSANFVNCKFRFEVEITEVHYNNLVKSKNSASGKGARSSEFEITSTKSGFVRVHNPQIKKLIEELEQEEFKLKESEEEFYQWLIGEFHKRSLKFCKLVESAAVLDCLASLANVARNSPYKMTRPRIHPKDKNVLSIRSSVYPISGVNFSNFVPNDVNLGSFGSNKPIAIITGPNMGGKSTLLRQIALTVIMGQIGSFVPATFCEFSIVDSLFTRLGASDNLVEGKSTFLVELEDIAAILTKGTSSSLAVIDELGRGTSTFDGAAIAVATLEKIAEMGCRCVFTTHFRDVCTYASEFQNVAMFHMGVNVDEETKNVEFLYKLRPGVCPDSHGMHVAQLARIPDHVLRNARKASEKLKSRSFASPGAALGGGSVDSPLSSTTVGDNDTGLDVSVKNEEEGEVVEEEAKLRAEEDALERIGMKILEAHRAGNFEILHDIFREHRILS